MKLIEDKVSRNSELLFKKQGCTKWEGYVSQCGLKIMYSEGSRDGPTLSVSWPLRNPLTEHELLELKLRFFGQSKVRQMPMIHSPGLYLIEEGNFERFEGVAEAVKKESPTVGDLSKYVERAAHSDAKTSFEAWAKEHGILEYPAVKKLLNLEGFPFGGTPEDAARFIEGPQCDGLTCDECEAIGGLLRTFWDEKES